MAETTGRRTSRDALKRRILDAMADTSHGPFTMGEITERAGGLYRTNTAAAVDELIAEGLVVAGSERRKAAKSWVRPKGGHFTTKVYSLASREAGGDS